MGWWPAVARKNSELAIAAKLKVVIKGEEQRKYHFCTHYKESSGLDRGIGRLRPVLYSSLIHLYSYNDYYRENEK